MQESQAISDLESLERDLRALGGALVAFSGGVDSGVLLVAAHRALGDRAVAFTADSPSLPRRELDEARRFTSARGIRHTIRVTDELDLEDYRRNDRNRCYWCKHTLFELASAIAAEENLPVITYGYTADDVGDHRPGHRAASEHQVRSPLFEAGLGKARIRAIARTLDLDLADKPAAPCLSSRIPHGTPVSPELLSDIEVVENYMHDRGFPVVRARFDGAMMRIELPSDDIARAVSPEIRDGLLQLGRERNIPLLTIDLEGFRSGKLNDPRLDRTSAG